MVDEGVIHVVSNSSDWAQTWCMAAKKNSSRWSSLWVLFLHTIARVVSEHHSNAPAFSTPIDYRNLSPFLLSLLFSADEGLADWGSLGSRRSCIRAPKYLLKFVAPVDTHLPAMFSLLQSLYLSPIPHPLKQSKERGFRSVERTIYNSIYSVSIAVLTEK